MQLGLFRREHLGSGQADLIGQATIDQFQRTHGALEAWSEVEHRDDGTHGAITAASIDIAGSAQIHGDLAVDGHTVMDTLRLRGALVFAEDEGDLNVVLTRGEVSTLPVLEATGNIVPAASLSWALGMVGRIFTEVRTLVAAIGGVSGTVTLSHESTVSGGLGVDNHLVPTTTAAFNLGHVALGALRWANLFLSGAVFEGARTTALGFWQAVTFGAGNFTGNGSMTWTVASGNVPYSKCTRVGRTLIWSFVVAGTSVGGTPNTQLLMTLPLGLSTVAAPSAAMAVAQAVDNGVVVDAFVTMVGATQLAVSKTSGANWAASAGATSLSATVIIETTT